MPREIQMSDLCFNGIRLFGIALGSARSVTKLEDELQHYRKQYLYRQGGTTMVPGADSYKLFSPNEGKDWYAINEDHQIMGTADDVYPGLLKHLDGMEVLTGHAGKYGPIDPSSLEGKDLLEKAGFTVAKEDFDN